jgi:predicted DNA-binding transcriptional regulator AlpA
MNTSAFTFVCGKCRKKTEFLTVQYVVAATGASRSSLYRWMDRGLLHYRVLPTRHRLICKESLRKIQPVS